MKTLKRTANKINPVNQNIPDCIKSDPNEIETHYYDMRKDPQTMVGLMPLYECKCGSVYGIPKKYVSERKQLKELANYAKFRVDLIDKDSDTRVYFSNGWIEYMLD